MTIKKWLKLTQRGFASTANRRRRRQGKKLWLQCLEQRHLLAASPWTNPINPLDVTGDLEVTTRDALVIINEVARAEASDPSDRRAPPILASSDSIAFHYDTNGDGEFSIRDALKVINAIGLGQTSTVAPTDAPEQSDEIDGDAEALVVSNNYAWAEGELISSTDRDVFQFVAGATRASINLSAITDESISVVRILDANRMEITSTARRYGNDRFAGVDFATTPGQTYFLVVDGAPGNEVTNFYFSLEVFQYDSSDWAPESDDAIGNDVHGDVLPQATNLEMSDGFVRVSSFIDHDDDQDVFRIDVSHDRVSVEVFGLEPPSFAASAVVLSADGLQRSALASVAGAITFATTPGEALYLVVSGKDVDDSTDSSTGQYVLDVNQYLASESLSAEEDLDGNSLETATPLTLEGDHHSAHVVRTLDSADDIDLFRFVTPEIDSPRALLIVAGYDSLAREVILNVDFDLLDADGQVIPKDNDDGTARPLGHWELTAGAEYFVKVFATPEFASFETGDYRLGLAISSRDRTMRPGTGGPGPGTGGGTVPPDSTLGNDVHADTPGEATLLTEQDGYTEVTSNIDSATDVDFFRLPVSRSGVGVVVVGEGNEITVFGDNGDLIQPTNAIVNDGMTTGGSFDAGDNEHVIIRVSRRDGQTGQYTLATLASGSNGNSTGGTNGDGVPSPDSPLGDDIHSDTADAATLLVAVNGATEVTSNIDSATDVDFFRLPVSQSRTGVLVVGAGNEVTVFDQAGTIIEPTDGIVIGGTTAGGSYDAGGSQHLIIRVSRLDGQTSQYTLATLASGSTGN